ncbi:2'-5' RNA ligase family protein [Novosphingobium sp.]|uniref:2'-5' RNA ligase family protein n=1 Tax=Novosphingobium sp. TaxID=1874826 RepID=UPI0025D76BAE|nr:2'-5' RNA ligase family protein [Novosphingobium sp.]
MQGADGTPLIGRAPPAPFIVTAELPADIFGWADRLRRAHFPAERNHLSAHVTLFHALAPSLAEQIKRVLAGEAAAHAAIAARLSGVMDLGKGTALVIESPAMLALRDRVADHFHGALSAQDQHRPRLHVTIQNKVTAQVARTLQSELAATFQPRDFRFVALAMHIYRGGPWEAAGRWSFRGRG